MERRAVSRTTFAVGLVIAVLVASVISVGISTKLAVGPQGLQGSKGEKGDKGDTGAVGPLGSPGPKGDVSATGDTGAQGPKGETGATGAQGPQGPQGPKGDTGASGPIGPQGPRGFSTPDYDSGWVDISDKAGQFFNVVHNLSSVDLLVDIIGKAQVSGAVHQRLGLSNYIPGWNKTYGGGTNREEGYSLTKTSDGGFVIAGRTYGSAGYDVYLVKTDPSGILQWQKTYGGPQEDVGRSVIETNDGGYAVVGFTVSGQLQCLSGKN